MPTIAWERFGLNNTLSVLKYSDDPYLELREGFRMSRRIDSLIRHY